MYLKVLHIVLVVLGCVAIVTTSVFEDSATETKLHTYIEASMKCRKIPGLTMGIVKDNATWSHGYGMADLDTDTPVTSGTRFGIGSVTKAFTMTLLGILLDEHGYTWSSKVTDVLGGEFKFVDDLRTSQTTVKDLLSHRTGLAALDFGLFVGYSPNVTTRAGLSERIQFLPATYDFRDKWSYNNLLYMLLGRMCETLGGDTWEKLLETRLLTPIGMTSTFLMENPQDLRRENVAKPYIYKDDIFVNGTDELYEIFPFEPAGAIFSTAPDMIKWTRFNMDGGKTEAGVQLVKKEMLDEAVQATVPFTDESLKVPEFPVSDTQVGYGYAWFVANYRGYHRFWHSGGLYSYVTYFWIFPDVNFGLFASVNGPAFQSGPAAALKTILYYASDIVLGETPWLNDTTTCSFPEPWHSAKSHNKSLEESGQLTNPRDYGGVYGNPMFPDVKVVAEVGNSENLRLDSGRLSGKLRPSQEKDRFLMEIAHPWEIVMEYTSPNNVTTETNVTFIRNGGEVRSVKLSFEAELTYTKGMSITDALPINGAISLRVSCFLFIAAVIHVQSCALLN